MAGTATKPPEAAGGLREILREAAGTPSSRGESMSEYQLVRIIESGLSTAFVIELKRRGYTDRELESLVIPRRTLSHRKMQGKPLTKEESDKAVRVARITDLADQVFGDHAKALRWLRKPKRGFGGRSPLDVMGTEHGARVVEEMLHQIDHGIAA